MPHGAPDASDVIKREVYDRVGDLAELAARLGAIPAFDRRGEWMFSQDFRDGGGAWTGIAGGVGAGMAKDTSYFLTGGASWKLSGASAGGAFMDAWIQLAYPDAEDIGLEMWISINGAQTYLTVTLTVWDGTTTWAGGLRYDHVNHELQYKQDGPTWVKLADLQLAVDLNPIFHNVKFVLDTAGGTYARAQVDGFAYDIAGIAVAHGASTSLRLLQIGVRTDDKAASQSIAYIDSVILTRNEP